MDRNSWRTFFLVLYFLIIFSCLKTFGAVQWHPSLAIQECPEPLLVDGYTGLSKTGYPTFFRNMHHIMFIHFLIKHSYFCGYPPFCGYKTRSRPSTWRKWFGGLSRAVCIVLWWKQFARYRSYEIRTVPVRLGVSIVIGVPEELDGSEKSWKILSKWMVPPYFRKLSYVGLMIIDMHTLGINTIHQLESLRIPNTGVKSSTSRVTFAGQLCHRVVRTSCLVMSTWLRSFENISIAFLWASFEIWEPISLRILFVYHTAEVLKGPSLPLDHFQRAPLVFSRDAWYRAGHEVNSCGVGASKETRDSPAAAGIRWIPWPLLVALFALSGVWKLAWATEKTTPCEGKGNSLCAHWKPEILKTWSFFRTSEQRFSSQCS